MLLASTCAIWALPPPASASPAPAPAPAANLGISLRRLSTDPFAGKDANQHDTEVEPDTFAFGSTIVAAFQAGRSDLGGSSDIGWATSENGGTTWKHAFLTGLTKKVGAGSYDRVSDPSVAYDAAHKTWLIVSLGVVDVESDPPSHVATAVLVSRSTNGGTIWSRPVKVATGNSLDKTWVTCDNTQASPGYGRCYTEFDSLTPTSADLAISVSRDGGNHWTAATVPGASVIGGQPLVQPNGRVVVPIHSNGGGAQPMQESFVSTDGATFTGPYPIALTFVHAADGDLRAGNLASAEIDGAGRVYVVWADCGFRPNCTSTNSGKNTNTENDLVMSTSADGTTWSTPVRIPIDPATSTVDHFIPGLAVDKTTSGDNARLALAYYYYPNARCAPQCNLDVGYITSSDGGNHWTTAIRLAGPMKVSWLPFSGLTTSPDLVRPHALLADVAVPNMPMVGDYISTSFVNHRAYPVFAVARPPKHGLLDEAIYTIESPPGAQHATFNCTIRSKANDRYVSADPAIDRMLRANAIKVGASQRYRCIAIGTAGWAIKSVADDRFVSTQLSYSGVLHNALRAGALRVGASQTFTFVSAPSCSCVALKAQDAGYVSVELSDTGPIHGLLRADSGHVGANEQFEIAPD